MIKLIKAWLAKKACMHKWITHFRIESYRDGDKLPFQRRQTLICSKCGKIKKIIL